MELAVAGATFTAGGIEILSVSREAGQPLIPNQGKIGAVFEAFVFEPKDVELRLSRLVSSYVSETLEPFGFFSLMTVFPVATALCRRSSLRINNSRSRRDRCASVGLFG